jgi:DNA-binding response OmpR family regulator
MMNRLLLVEDDAALARVLCDALRFAGFDVQLVTNGDLAVQRVREYAPDLILLDIMLPGRDGFELCGVLREGGRRPVIMLTARGQKGDKVRGFEVGADDYVTKPYHLEELLARIKAVLRRAKPAIDRLILGTVTIDFNRLEATVGGRPVHLTHREFDVLRYLSERAGRVVSRTELLREVWGYLDVPNTRSVDDAIARLRKKLEPDSQASRLIHTAHGDGYCLKRSDT